jgi:hypothetical protein
MKRTLNELSEIIAKANDIFCSQFTHINTLIGIMDKNLRNQGIKADVITIDCTALNKKIVFLIHDDTPEVVSIALGNKLGDIYSSSEYIISEISETIIVKIIKDYFIL